MHLRTSFFDRGDAVCVDDRVRDGAVLDDTTVDKDVLWTTGWTLLRQRGHVSGHFYVAAVAAHFDQVISFAVQLVQSVLQLCHGRTLQHLPPGTGQREADLGITKSELRDDARDLRRLRSI